MNTLVRDDVGAAIMGSMRRLIPDPVVTLDVADAYAAPLGSRTDRPWVSLCMIAGLDGAVAVDGRSGGLSGVTDRAVLRQLRAIADVIIVGASTARVEGYGPPSKAGQRIGVVTLSGNVDAGSELFTSGRGFVVTSEDADLALPGEVDVVRAGRGRVDVAAAIEMLPRLIAGCQTVQAEGGPTLNAALFAADVIDEIDQTTAPLTVGGPATPGAGAGVEHRHAFDLAQLAVDDESYVFARWLRRH